LFIENLKIKSIFILLFITVHLTLYNINSNNQSLEINTELNKFSTQLQTSLNAIIEENYNEAESTSSILDGEKILRESMFNALKADDKTKKKLREKLYKHLNPLYQIIKEEGVSNFQFILPDNSSFLKMDEPKLFGNTITTFNNIHRTYKEVSGFKKEHDLLTFSYNFPILNEDDVYLGAYDISYSIDYMQELMLNIDNIKTSFLLKGTNFKKDGWEDKYQEINNNISDNKTFTLYIQNDSSVDVLSFLPLKNNQKNKTFAYLISHSKSLYIQEILQDLKVKIYFRLSYF
jgi:hypothetical protein